MHHVLQAMAMFVVTNIDDIVILTMLFARTPRASHVVIGQYVGFTALVVLSIVGALGTSLLPESLRPFLGLLPIALGTRAALAAFREHRRPTNSADDTLSLSTQPIGMFGVASLTFANGGDNIAVYVPVFTTAGTLATATYLVVFLCLVGVWCVIGRFLATRRPIASALADWGHVLLPIVLFAIGFSILLN